MTTHNASSQVKDYRGVLVFPSVIDTYAAITYPLVSIPLFLKEHPIPVRKQKITEINTIPNVDPNSSYETSISVAFSGGQEPLELNMTGFLQTPADVNKFWAPTVDGSKAGALIHSSLSGVSYADLISAYIEGRMKRTATGRWQRVDPVLYIDPYGNKYDSPKIVTWDPSYSPTQKRQVFSLVLALETWT